MLLLNMKLAQAELDVHPQQRSEETQWDMRPHAVS
jgi:hypothetical protein